jgi:hypothetical protein
MSASAIEPSVHESLPPPPDVVGVTARSPFDDEQVRSARVGEDDEGARARPAAPPHEHDVAGTEGRLHRRAVDADQSRAGARPPHRPVLAGFM